MSFDKKTDYNTEYSSLTRQQYKESAVVNSILKCLGGQSQQIEEVLFDIDNINENYGAVIDGEGRNDPLERLAGDFNIQITSGESPDNYIDEIKAKTFLIRSKCLPKDLEGMAMLIYGLRSQVIAGSGGVHINVFGDVSSDGGRKALLLYRTAIKCIPVGVEFGGIVETRDDNFSVSGFPLNTNGWRLSSTDPDPGAVFSKLIVNSEGEFIDG